MVCLSVNRYGTAGNGQFSVSAGKYVCVSRKVHHRILTGDLNIGRNQTAVCVAAHKGQRTVGNFSRRIRPNAVARISGSFNGTVLHNQFSGFDGNVVLHIGNDLTVRNLQIAVVNLNSATGIGYVYNQRTVGNDHVTGLMANRNILAGFGILFGDAIAHRDTIGTGSGFDVQGSISDLQITLAENHRIAVCQGVHRTVGYFNVAVLCIQRMAGDNFGIHRSIGNNQIAIGCGNTVLGKNDLAVPIQIRIYSSIRNRNRFCIHNTSAEGSRIDNRILAGNLDVISTCNTVRRLCKDRYLSIVNGNLISAERIATRRSGSSDRRIGDGQIFRSTNRIVRRNDINRTAGNFNVLHTETVVCHSNNFNVSTGIGSSIVLFSGNGNLTITATDCICKCGSINIGGRTGVAGNVDFLRRNHGRVGSSGNNDTRIGNVKNLTGIQTASAGIYAYGAVRNGHRTIINFNPICSRINGKRSIGNNHISGIKFSGSLILTG